MKNVLLFRKLVVSLQRQTKKNRINKHSNNIKTYENENNRQQPIRIEFQC